MTNTDLMLNSKKYRIDDFVNSNTRELIKNHLDISESTFIRKTKILVKDQGGFEICQLKQIADILERPILDLLTTEAKIYFGFTKQDTPDES